MVSTGSGLLSESKDSHFRNGASRRVLRVGLVCRIIDGCGLG